jgi:hypothetical protein
MQSQISNATARWLELCLHAFSCLESIEKCTAMTWHRLWLSRPAVIGPEDTLATMHTNHSQVARSLISTMTPGLAMHVLPRLCSSHRQQV